MRELLINNMEIEYVKNFHDVNAFHCCACLGSAYNNLIGYWSVKTFAETSLPMTQIVIA